MHPNTIQMYSGRFVEPLNPNIDDINIIDFTHALSNKCRFTGHTDEFYSVAQHSALVSCVVERLAKQEGLSEQDVLLLAKQGLLHEGDEVALPDIPTPIKVLEQFAFLKRVAKEWNNLTMQKFKLPYVEHPLVKKADRILLITEKRDLMKTSHAWCQEEETIVPLKNRIIPLPPPKAKHMFMLRYRQLFGEWTP